MKEHTNNKSSTFTIMRDEFFVSVDDMGMDIENTQKTKRAVRYVAEAYPFDELVNTLSNVNYEAHFLEFFMRRYSELYSRALVSGIRKFRKFLLLKGCLFEIGETHGPLGNVIAKFEATLISRGYSPGYIKNIIRAPKRLFASFRFSEMCKLLGTYEFEDQFMLAIESEYCQKHQEYYMAGFRRFREFLIELRVVEQPLKVATRDGFSAIIQNYSKYLSEERDYTKQYAIMNLSAVSKLQQFLRNNGYLRFEDLTADIMLEFSLKNKLGKSYNGGIQNFLKYLFREQYLNFDLSGTIRIKRKSADESRKYLSPEDIDKLLSVLPRERAHEKRNYAIFLMMARMGLRIGDAKKIKLKDIDWRRSRIRFEGKAKKVSELPFTREVQEALVDYLECSIRSESEYLFLCAKPPYGRVVSNNKLHDLLIESYNKSGVKCPSPTFRFNVFRHSFATRKLNSGVPMIVVRDLLRHESVDVTAVYAKYNLPSLRAFANEWPGGGCG